MNDRINKLREKLVNTLVEHKIKRAAFFGSVVRDDFSDDSDIDLLVEFEGRKGLLDLVRLKLELTALIGRKVDIITYNSLHPGLKTKILNEQRIIF